MRALLVNSYSARNAGDAAIVLATADLLWNHRIERFTNSTRYYAEDAAFYEARGIEIEKPVIPFPERGKKAKAFFRPLRFFFSLLIVSSLAVMHKYSPRRARHLAATVKLTGLVTAMDVDYVVVCGGGYIYSSRRRVNLTLVHMLMSVQVARLLNKPIIMMPQSIGPLFKRFDRWLTRVTLRNVNPIVVRDSSAVAEVENILDQPSRVILCPDIAFHGWQSKPLQKAVSAHTGGSVGIVVMDWTWAREVDTLPALDIYARKIAQVVVELDDKGIKVNLLGHSRLPEHNQDDLAVAGQVAAIVKGMEVAPPTVVDLNSDPDQILAFFSNLRVIVGTRLHSCIISMVSGTPAIALSYQPKAVGTYELLGLADMCYDVEQFSSTQLTAAIMRVLNQEASLVGVIGEAVDRARNQIVCLYDTLV